MDNESGEQSQIQGFTLARKHTGDLCVYYEDGF